MPQTGSTAVAAGARARENGPPALRRGGPCGGSWSEFMGPPPPCIVRGWATDQGREAGLGGRLLGERLGRGLVVQRRGVAEVGHELALQFAQPGVAARVGAQLGP